MSMDFLEFPKMARLSRECLITEKLDGTNGCVCVVDHAAGDFSVADNELLARYTLASNGPRLLLAGSRSKWITPADDNHGFAKWVQANAEGLFWLGAGRHFGEWCGQGIQRKYGLTEKRFSLFNAQRWCARDVEPALIPSGDPRAEPKYQERAPACCHIVPVLYRGPFSTPQVDSELHYLRAEGSRAAPGFMNPEGVVVFHTAGNVGFKKTLEKDEVPKSFKR